MLNHVSQWDKNHGWLPTSAYKAQGKYPCGLSSRSREYLCEACGQYVTLKNSNLGTPFFCHPKGSSDCVDKIDWQSDAYFRANPLGFSLPIRISVANDIEVYIGFLPLLAADIERFEIDNAALKILNNSKQVIRNYLISTERFSCEHITYLSVGQEICDCYYLELKYSDNYHWPRIINGIKRYGTLFDPTSGKRIPQNSNVQIGKSYWVLSQYPLYEFKDISVSQEKVSGDWKLYRVRADILSKETANYFFKFGVRLTDEISSVTHIWPPAIRSSHFITHCSEKIWFHKTEGYIDVYPLHKQYRYDNGLIAIDKSSFEQILSLSRFDNNANVLKYTLIRYSSEITVPIPSSDSAYITDILKKPLKSGEFRKLPAKNTVVFYTMYDGMVQIIEDGLEIDRQYVKAGQCTEISVRFGPQYQFFQGLDCIYKIIYSRANFSNDDDILLASLLHHPGDKVAAPNTLGSIACHMKDMPRSKQWLLKQIRSGTISNYSLKLLKARFRRT